MELIGMIVMGWLIIFAFIWNCIAAAVNFVYRAAISIKEGVEQFVKV